MKKIQIGNDIKLVWTITGLQGELGVPVIELIGPTGKTVPFDSSRTGNVVSGIFFGGSQKTPGTYTLRMTIGYGGTSQTQLYSQKAFRLVKSLYGKTEEGTDPVPVGTETISITSNISTGDGVGPESDPYFRQSAAYGITQSDINNWNSMGSYENLTGKPVIPTKTSELTNDSGFLTSDQDSPIEPEEVQNILNLIF